MVDLESIVIVDLRILGYSGPFATSREVESL